MKNLYLNAANQTHVIITILTYSGRLFDFLHYCLFTQSSTLSPIILYLIYILYINKLITCFIM